mmetsp:Transcript_17442/g.53636  ORF Transcript_17442/g.53636 Transcript_17442/m.53636 type:complete len:116 (+) Transcript_17442:838-1185(+)
MKEPAPFVQEYLQTIHNLSCRLLKTRRKRKTESRLRDRRFIPMCRRLERTEFLNAGTELHSSRDTYSIEQEANLIQLCVAQDAYTASCQTHQHLVQRLKEDALVASVWEGKRLSC